MKKFFLMGVTLIITCCTLSISMTEKQAGNHMTSDISVRVTRARFHILFNEYPPKKYKGMNRVEVISNSNGTYTGIYLKF